MNTTLSEQCGCGATFTITTSAPESARYAAQAFRENHKHRDPEPADDGSDDGRD